MKTHLVRWDDQYRRKGLVIVNVNNGQIDDFDTLRRSIAADARIRYPVGWDESARACKDYGVRGYAASFLIGTNGKVVWEGFPLTRPIGEREELIKKELAKVTEDELSKIRLELGG
jgi:hypothetical protein